MITIAHIVNPCVVDPTSDLFRAQPVTFECMEIARQFALADADVTLFAIQHSSEPRIDLPECFVRAPDLHRTVGDVHTFAKPRMLPLISDILDRLYNATAADYLVYTNVDIAPQPYFYSVVAGLISSGYDAFVINRRAISADLQSLEELPMMWAECGDSHPGHDCFIFRRDAFPSYRLGNICIGTRLIGRVMVWNLLAHAQRYFEFKDLHLTFHIGQEKPWKSSEFQDYDRHNHAEALNVLRELDSSHGLLARLEKDYPDYLVGIDTACLTRPTD